MVRSTRDLSEGSRFLGLDGRSGEFEAVVVLLGISIGCAQLFGQVLNASRDPAAQIGGGITQRPPDTQWVAFVSDIEPHRTEMGWTNRVIGSIPENMVSRWNRLYQSQIQLSTILTFEDLSDLQIWVPRIRCFSYFLSSP